MTENKCIDTGIAFLSHDSLTIYSILSWLCKLKCISQLPVLCAGGTDNLQVPLFILFPPGHASPLVFICCIPVSGFSHHSKKITDDTIDRFTLLLFLTCLSENNSMEVYVQICEYVTFLQDYNPDFGNVNIFRFRCSKMTRM
jgi:hypothetical protein